MEFPLGKSKTKQKNAILTLLSLTALIMILIIVTAPHYHLINITYTFSINSKASSASSAESEANIYKSEIAGGGGDGFMSSSDIEEEAAGANVEEEEKCDVFSGEWIPNPEAPYYTNETCWAIHEHQNCMKYGRPDSEFMKWRWKPDGCELPVVDPVVFLEIVRGKSMAFIGDSVARNQMQSLICLLSRVEFPVDASNVDDDYFRRWKYPTYNFTIAAFWSPFLIKVEQPNPKTLPNLYLDEFDEKWTTKIDEFDYIILSGGHWFPHPTMYYENRSLVGCRFCQEENITDYPTTYGYRRAFKTAYKAITSSRNYKGMTFLRTYAPSHFENGEYNTGGNCVRERPFKSDEIVLEGNGFELYMTQMEEFRVAQRVGKRKGLTFKLLDVTQATLLRPDGHPSVYGHRANENVVLYNDCVHWCLPGPIDSWNDFLQHYLKKDSIGSL